MADRRVSVIDVTREVEQTALKAAAATPALRSLTAEALDDVLRDVADRLDANADAVLAANRDDLASARSTLSTAVLDRLGLDRARLLKTCEQLRALAELPAVSPVIERVKRDGRVIEVRRIPVGVIGANYEARANVTVDIASQLIKSRNGGVLRTGAAALRTASAMVDLGIGPALQAVGVSAARSASSAGPTTRQRRHSLRCLGSASGDTPRQRQTDCTTRPTGRRQRRADASPCRGRRCDVRAARRGHRSRLRLVERGLDRLGVCNRLNLLLIDSRLWDELAPRVVERLTLLGIQSSLPPHKHELGYEWATDPERAGGVTLAPAQTVPWLRNWPTRNSWACGDGCRRGSNAASEFIESPRGTGVFWNETTRLLDGYELFRAPGTGISTEHVPGPRGPVTYQDLHLVRLWYGQQAENEAGSARPFRLSSLVRRKVARSPCGSPSATSFRAREPRHAAPRTGCLRSRRLVRARARSGPAPTAWDPRQARLSVALE